MSIKNNKGESATNLLSDILEETRDPALEERRRLEAARQAREAEEIAREDRKRAELQARAQAQILAERDRRHQAAQRRSDLMRVIEGPSQEELDAIARAELETRKRAEIQARLEAAEIARAEAERKAEAAERLARQREAQRLDALANAPAPAPQGRSRLALGIAAAAMSFAALLLVGGLATGIILHQQRAPEAMTFSKATPLPLLVQSEGAIAGFVEIPAPQDDPAPNNRNRTNRNNRNNANRNNGANNGNRGNTPTFNIGNIDGDDVFRGGKE